MSDQTVGYAWTKDGHLIFSQSDSASSTNSVNLWYLMVDPDSGVPSGEPVRMTGWDNMIVDPGGISSDGKRLIVAKSHVWQDAMVGELKENGTRLEKQARLTSSDSQNYPNSWFRDNKSILITSDRAGGRLQLYRHHIDQDVDEPFVSGQEDEASAELTPDGKTVLFWASPHSTATSNFPPQTLMRVSADGGSSQRILETSGGPAYAFHCAARPGGGCVLSLLDKDQLVFYSLDPMKGQGNELARTKIGEPGNWISWALSPDGKRIALSGSSELDDRMRILELGTSTQTDWPIKMGAFGASWSVDGRAAYIAGQEKDYDLLRLDLSGKTQLLLRLGRPHWLTSPVTSPDGRYLAFTEQSIEANAFLFEND